MLQSAGITVDLIELGVEHKIIDKSGSWFSYGDLRIGQGRENARLFLRENTDVAATVEQSVREKLGLVKTAAVPVSDEATPAPAGTTPTPAADKTVTMTGTRAVSPAPADAPVRGRGRARAGA